MEESLSLFFIYMMEQLTSSLVPPRASSKSNVASSGQQVAGSVAKRYVFLCLPGRILTEMGRLSNELMTLMVCGYISFAMASG